MPRLIDKDHCPHCGVKRTEEDVSVCTECGGSLQQRHLKAGCISTAPLWILMLWLLD